MTNPQTAVTVVEQSAGDAVVEWNLDDFPTDRFNRLVPTQTLMVPTDLLRPVVQVVQLSPDPKAGDVYTSRDMPEGHAAPTKVALRKFATAAGISFVDERRTDDGSDPDVIEITCVAEMLLPTGQRLRATGVKRVDLNAQAWQSENHRKKFKSFFLEHVASRAENRAIRALLSLRGSYPLETYQRPFAVVSYAPNLAHPEVRARVLDAMAPAAAALYGPPEQKQLGPGQAIDVTPAPEEDPAPAAPTVLPGEHLAKAEDTAPPAVPSWMSDEPAASTSTSPLDAFVQRIRAAAADPAAPKGAPTGPVLESLRNVLAPLGGPAVIAGMQLLFGDEAIEHPSAAQARAVVIEAGDDLEALRSSWRELVEKGVQA